MGLVTVVATPVLAFAAAPLATLLGLRGPCGPFAPPASAFIALAVGVPAALLFSFGLIAVRAAGIRRSGWGLALLVLYAVGAVPCAVWVSAMCK